uniref:DUF668 domain-containing protein n=1 Tax=Fagus sylvatica TaxID=28930 RepID=A0A2N9F0D9_FAGSY
MVVATMAWLSGATKTLHYRQIFSNHHHHHHHQKSSPSTLGILAFETAKTMSRLVSLYNSLTDHQIFKLRKEIMRSKGVTYLNSKDEGFLLNLACYERLEDLNQAAIAVSRLGQKCSDLGLNRFDIIYNDLKHGIIDLGKLEFGTRNVHKIIERMEKSIYSTANLHAALENLAELESSERKLERWKNTLGPKQMSNLEYVKEKIAFQNKQVQHYREISLWNQGFDKNVEHMARIVCVIYARICSIFGPYISDLPSLSKNTRPNSNHKKLQFWFHHQLHEELDYCLMEDRDKHGKPISRSGPIPNNSKKDKVRFFSHEMNQNSPDNKNRSAIKKNNGVFALAPPSTVGGSGLSLRYANIIIHAERCLYAPATIGEDARQALYEMLPARLKTTVKTKLKRHWLKKEEASDVSDGYSMAEGWRDALEEIMGWLVPMAHDTVTWQAERNLERQKFDSKPTVLLLQTLHYSDLEMTEAAIIEVLVGLSCIYRYENRCLPGSGSASVHMII